MSQAKREPWIEYALRTWGEWVCDLARWQGWGSGVDRAALMADAGWGHSRSPGTYSNPVLAEVMAMLHDGQGRHARIHAEIIGLPTIERRIMVARYCGRPIVTERHMRSQADMPPWQRTKNQQLCWIEYCWSGGPLPFAQISQLVGRSASTCHEALDRARIRLQFRLEVRRSIAEGRFAPDGGSLRQEELEDAA